MTEKKAKPLEGWVCPRCGYVWAIYVEGCKNCNMPGTTTGSATTEIDTIPYQAWFPSRAKAHNPYDAGVKR